MTGNPIQLRPAETDDARALTELINLAGEGLPVYLWTNLAEPGQDAWEVGRARALREEGAFSYRNGVIAEANGNIAGCHIGYPLREHSGPVDLTSVPPMFVPLEELEALAANTWYVNVLAVYPEFRGKGVGSRLLEHAEDTARARQLPGMSLIVADTNINALRLYEKTGYRKIATRPVVKERWRTDAREWVLMTKTLESGHSAQVA